MSIIDRLIAPFMNYLNKRFGTADTRAGQKVTTETPFELVSYRSLINILAFDVATITLEAYKRRSGGGRDKATDHPLYDVLSLSPNGRMTAFEWRAAMMTSLLTWGNCYNQIIRDEFFRVIALWPLRPDRMTVYIGEDGRLKYDYSFADGETTKTFDYSEILHVKGFSSDGLVGRTPLWDLREKLGEVAGIEAFSQSFYGNGMKRSGVLTHPGTLGETQRKNLAASVADNRDPDKAWSVLVLEEGMTFNELTFAPEDAQLLSTREFSVLEFCRVLNMPPYKAKVVAPGAVSYASVDAQYIDYLTSSLMPWFVNFEQAIMRGCLTRKERAEGYFVEHNTREWLRADLKSQAEALGMHLRNGAFNIDEYRGKLGENPLPNGMGQHYFRPLDSGLLLPDGSVRSPLKEAPPA